MQDMEPAGLQKRIIACLLDCFILGTPSFVIIGGEYYIHVPYFPKVICLALGIIYSVGFLSSAWQATPGMRLLNIFVVRAEDAGKLSHARGLARYLIYNAAFLFLMAIPSLNPRLPANLRGDEARRYEALYEQDQLRRPMKPEDRQFLDKAYAEVGSARKSAPREWMLTAMYTLIIALTIGLTKRKTGLHDMVCKTRVVRRASLAVPEC